MHFTKILFYEENYREPLDFRSVTKLLQAFPRSYTDVVKTIIENSQNLTEKTFKCNVALLMSSFGMTRSGAFKGIRLVNALDPDNVINSCWKEIKDDLQHIRTYIDENAANHKRSSRLVKLSTTQKDYVIKKTRELFTALCEIGAKSGQARRARVGASKILFAALPEVALPVDNLEWDYVFKTDDYGEIIATMADEIDQWQIKTGKSLNEDCAPPTHRPTTLPSIYNVLAMSVRPLERLPRSKTLKQYDNCLRESQR